MDEGEIDRAWDQLRQALETAIELLSSAGEVFWATRLQQGLSKVEASGGNGLDSILSLFGGMGSFNDLVLNPMNGNDIAEADVRAVNERLGELRDQIYAPAKELRRAFSS